MYEFYDSERGFSHYRGRPAEEDGHEPITISLNRKIRQALKKLKKGEISKFIEDKLEPHLKKLDPGDACLYVKKIFEELEDGVRRGLNEGNYESAEVLIDLMRKFDKEIELCEIEKRGHYRRLLRKV